MLMLETLLFFYTPIGMVLWITLAMYHLRRRHQIREKAPVLYWFLLIPDGLGYVADVLANYTWASVILWNRPRFRKDELTISQHMARIQREWLAAGAWHDGSYSFSIAFRVCNWLDKLDPSGDHC